MEKRKAVGQEKSRVSCAIPTAPFYKHHEAPTKPVIRRPSIFPAYRRKLSQTLSIALRKAYKGV